MIEPAGTVAKRIHDRHQTWMDTPGRGNKLHVDNSMREFQLEPGDERYHNCWDFFGDAR